MAKKKEGNEETLKSSTFEFKIEALRRLGEMLKAGQDAGQVAKAGDRRKYSDKEYLDDLGLDATTSHIAQKLAELPQEQFEAVKREMPKPLRRRVRSSLADCGRSFQAGAG